MRLLPRWTVLVASVAAAACKRDAPAEARPDAAVPSTPPSTSVAEPPPSAPPSEAEPPPPSPKLKVLVDAVATDPVVSEEFRLMLDGLEWSEVEEPFAARLKTAPKQAVACAYARVHAALEATKAEPKHDPRFDAALASLDGALGGELDGRKIDRSKTGDACPDASR